MGRQVTISVFPFQFRFGASAAVPTALNLRCTVTALTSLNDFMAQTVVVAAAFGGHEGTLTALSNGLTNHGYHSPFHLFEHKKWPDSCRIQPFTSFCVGTAINKAMQLVKKKTSHLVRMAANTSCSKRGKVPAVTLLPVISPHRLKPLACTLSLQKKMVKRVNPKQRRVYRHVHLFGDKGCLRRQHQRLF